MCELTNIIMEEHTAIDFIKLPCKINFRNTSMLVSGWRCYYRTDAEDINQYVCKWHFVLDMCLKHT